MSDESAGGRPYQRQHTRQEVDRAITACFRSGGANVEARVVDSSDGGLGVEMPIEMVHDMPGRETEFEVTIRTEHGEEQRRARVAWTRTVDKIRRAGIEFLGGKS